MTVPLPPTLEMMTDLGTLTVCRMDAAIDYAAAVSAADNAALREALQYAVKQVPELATVPGIRAALGETK
jgi:hypothetical protein